MEISALARTVAAEHETRNPILICKNMGVIVQWHELLECRGYYMRVLGRSYVTLATDLSEKEALFVCAHELGHYLLHQQLNRIFMDYRTFMVAGHFENEADKFAAHLLFGGESYLSDPITDLEMSTILNTPICNVNARLTALGVYR